MHLSIRVPWHDAGWNGTVCRQPSSNVHCLVLSRIAADRDDELEDGLATTAFDPLGRKLPACAAERGAFMSPSSHNRRVRHPYAEFSPAHAHFRETTFEHKPYSAACVPFNWMLRGNVETDPDNDYIGLADKLQLGFDSKLEPDLSFTTEWVQHKANQLVMLDTFFSAIQPEESLCFFYAKRTPLSDDPRRVIVAVGRVTRVDDFVEYEYKEKIKGANALEGVLWERNVHHSIRPDFEDGFVLPYVELLASLSPGESLDSIQDCIAFAPEEHWGAFSFTAEHVTQDGAVASLLACAAALAKVEARVPGPWRRVQEWISARLNEVWQLRGAYPGFGAALAASGVEHPALLAHEIDLKARSVQQKPFDPWSIFEAALENPGSLRGFAAAKLGAGRRDIWRSMPPERKALLKLLSRFPLTANQAQRWYEPSDRRDAGIDVLVSDDAILANPYLVFELDRRQLDAISLRSVDRGLFPDASIAVEAPLPKPSAPTDAADPRRAHAVLTHVLSRAAADEGHTLVPADQLLERSRVIELTPGCPLNKDQIDALKPKLGKRIVVTAGPNGAEALQLAELAEAKSIIATKVNNRIKGTRHIAANDWRALVDAAIGSSGQTDETEEQARREKAAALAELYASRLSVLIGAAGTGKTTLLRALCHMPEVRQGGVLLLAPTGKARVRLERGTMMNTAQTVAQFLNGLGRYNAESGSYFLSKSGKTASTWKTVIIDECSMITEVQLAAVLESLAHVERLVMVGDPNQLPPIGEGRPFADMVAYLRPQQQVTFPRVATGYAELTIPRRYGTSADDDAQRLASWFGGDAPDPGSDDVWSSIAAGTSESLQLVRWDTPAELNEKLEKALVAELERRGFPGDEVGLALSLGGEVVRSELRYRVDEDNGAAKRVETWQILTPLRSGDTGADGLNRLVKLRFRSEALKHARAGTHVPRPLGSHMIVYGDKVMNLRNGRRHIAGRHWTEREYVANGEIGVVVGKRGSRPRNLEIAFESYPHEGIDFRASEFENDTPIDLAFALTVHKTQGSEFGTTFVVLPNPCTLLSRELMYTALTRQKDRVVILHQGELTGFRALAGADSSVIAQRMTNLFGPPSLVRIPAPAGSKRPDTFLDSKLLHRTVGNLLVRSKSELVVASLLESKCGSRYRIEYERPLEFPDGRPRYPDFTISDDDSGRTYYWEHAGMIHVKSYRDRWKAKLEGYHKLGILPLEEGGGPKGTLIFTTDTPDGGLDAARIAQIIEEVLLG